MHPRWSGRGGCLRGEMMGSNRLTASYHSCHVCPIDTVHKRQQFTGPVELEIGVPGQELVHYLGVLLRLEAAGAVNQPSTRSQEGRGLAQQFQLCRAQTTDFARS